MFISFRIDTATLKGGCCLSVQIQVSGFKKRQEKRDVKESSNLKQGLRTPSCLA